MPQLRPRPRLVRSGPAQGPDQGFASENFFWAFWAVFVGLVVWSQVFGVVRALALDGPAELSALREGRVVGDGSVEEGGRLRERALKEAALSLSIQAGAKWRYERIVEEIVKPRAQLLDELFDFSPLVSGNGKLVMIPPVATSAGEAIRLADSRTALGQDGSYSLISEARLAGVPPNWRHYLLKAPQGPQNLHKALRPKGGAEAKRWKKEVDRGWRLGLEQADRLFAANVAALTRDYVGMMIFKRLLLEKYAQEAGTQETITSLEVREREIIFQKTLYQLVGQDGFVAPNSARAGRAKDKPVKSKLTKPGR